MPGDVPQRSLRIRGEVLDLADPDRVAVADGHAAGIDDDPIEPALDVGRIPKTTKLASYSHERLLDRVTGIGLGPQNREGEPVRVIDLRLGEAPEGGAVSPLGPSDERGEGVSVG